MYSESPKRATLKEILWSSSVRMTVFWILSPLLYILGEIMVFVDKILTEKPPKFPH